jgi:hypothetical protein
VNRKLVFAAFYLGLGVGMAQAQSSSCACRTTIAPGSVLSTKGTVMVSGKNGLVPASAGSPISAGSQLIVGHGGQTTFSLGGCHLQLNENSAATFVQTGGQMCVRLSQGSATTVSQISPLAIGAGVAGIGAIAAAAGLGGGSDKASN